MLTLYYGPGACSMASHIVLEESGEKYEPKRMDLAKGEQRTPDYLKMNPLGRVPLLQLDNGEPLAENTAILPYLGKRFDLWPTDPTAEAKALSTIGFFASSVHPAHAHVGRPSATPPTSRRIPASRSRGSRPSTAISSRSTECSPAANGSATIFGARSVWPSSSTPGACGANCRWRN